MAKSKFEEKQGSTSTTAMTKPTQYPALILYLALGNFVCLTEGAVININGTIFPQVSPFYVISKDELRSPVKITCSFLPGADQFYGLEIQRCVYSQENMLTQALGCKNDQQCTMYTAFVERTFKWSDCCQARHCGEASLSSQVKKGYIVLTLLRPTCHDAGKYTCRTQVSWLFKPTEDTLSLEMLPGRVMMAPTVKDGPVKWLLITCEVFSTVRVQWVWMYMYVLSLPREWLPIRLGDVKHVEPHLNQRCDLPWKSTMARAMSEDNEHKTYICNAHFTYANLDYNSSFAKHTFNGDVNKTTTKSALSNRSFTRSRVPQRPRAARAKPVSAHLHSSKGATALIAVSLLLMIALATLSFVWARQAGVITWPASQVRMHRRMQSARLRARIWARGLRPVRGGLAATVPNSASEAIEGWFVNVRVATPLNARRATLTHAGGSVRATRQALSPRPTQSLTRQPSPSQERPTQAYTNQNTEESRQRRREPPEGEESPSQGQDQRGNESTSSSTSSPRPQTPTAMGPSTGRSETHSDTLQSETQVRGHSGLVRSAACRSVVALPTLALDIEDVAGASDESAGTRQSSTTATTPRDGSRTVRSSSEEQGETLSC